ncbi:MAG: response regulator transcription factor [Eubacterium sp.]|nr:response regulator transcription factor [Eubacterium sp.]
MLNIYLCEDNDKQREIISNHIQNTVLIEDADLNFVKATADPHEIISLIENHSETGLYFLDIDLNSDINGLTLAKEIRKYDSRGFIVFVTTHSEMSYMTFTYKVEAMDFIVKDNQSDMGNRIRKCILDAYSRYASSNNNTDLNYVIKLSDKEYCIPYDDIIYFESSLNPHKVIVHTVSSTLEFQGKLKDIAATLDGRFSQCHRSYLINKNHISEIDIKERTIQMSNNDVCFASAKQLKTFI